MSFINFVMEFMCSPKLVCLIVCLLEYLKNYLMDFYETWNNKNLEGLHAVHEGKKKKGMVKP